MPRRIIITVGVVMLLAGILGFVVASVGLANADRVDIVSPADTQLRRAEDDPLYIEKKQQAEVVLFGSLIVGFIGLLTLAAGLRLPDRSNQD